MKDNYIKTPLNYTGNKYRLLNQIQPYFPKNINIMVDLFCGGTTVGLNTECNEIYFVDNNPQLIGLLRFFSTQKFDFLLENLEKLVYEYDLSNSYRKGINYYKDKIKDENGNNGLKEYNKKGFYRLRTDYNRLIDKTTDEAFMKLYLLLLYGFNNDLRFNSKSEFNLPVGKTDLNKANVLKLKKYLDKVKEKNVHYICAEFDSYEVGKILEIADFIYMDPPYLITKATYNETNRWNNFSEHKLLNLLDSLIYSGKQFVLSNVLSKKNKMNEPLFYWTQKNNERIEIYHMEYSYTSASYNKKDRTSKEDEIIVTWKKKNENK